MRHPKPTVEEIHGYRYRCGVGLADAKRHLIRGWLREEIKEATSLEDLKNCLLELLDLTT